MWILLELKLFLVLSSPIVIYFMHLDAGIVLISLLCIQGTVWREAVVVTRIFACPFCEAVPRLTVETPKINLLHHSSFLSLTDVFVAFAGMEIIALSRLSVWNAFLLL